MCGIAGGWWLNNHNDDYLKMSDSLKFIHHRGPDDRGCEYFDIRNSKLVLGHTRLSIIDLSSSGHQPMTTQDGLFTIVFNGEIYNYKELKSELISLGYSFITDTDTEVLLIAWQHWGERCLSKLIGMFAFVVFDKQKETLTCIRDAFGIKPFFYTFENKNFYFASEIEVIKHLKSSKVELNVQSAYNYLVHGFYDSKEETFYQDIKHLLPAHMLTIDLTNNNLVEYSQWWKPSIEENKTLSFSDATELVREKFLESIKLHMRSDVKVGAALSGGLDSSAIVCALRYLEPDIDLNTFSFVARGSKVNEEKWVDLVNNETNAIGSKIAINSDELVNDLDSMIIAQGEPFGSTSIYAQYKVMERAKSDGITVMLEGQGADELLAGYHGYPGSRLHSLIEEGHVIEAYNFLNNWSKWPGRSKSNALKLFTSSVMPQNMQVSLRAINGMPAVPNWLYANILKEENIVCGHPKEKYQITQSGRRVMADLANALCVRGIPHLLRHGDRNAMKYSIENRVPFLTLPMADLMLSLPESYLISNQGETKSIFRAAMKGIVPDEILHRRDKVGFETPELDWMIKHEKLFKKWLSEDLNLPFINQKEVIRSFDEIIKGERKFSWQAWRWLNFYRWYVLSF